MPIVATLTLQEQKTSRVERSFTGTVTARETSELGFKFIGTVKSLSVDNVFDREISHILGTFRRGRQVRWSMTWPFYN